MYGKIANDDTRPPADTERSMNAEEGSWDRGPVKGWQKEAAEKEARQFANGGVPFTGSFAYDGMGLVAATGGRETIDHSRATLRLALLRQASDEFKGMASPGAIIDRAKAFEDYVTGARNAERDNALAKIADLARHAGV